MSMMTPAHELFRELADLGNLLYCVLAGPRVSVRRWPSYYLLYVQIDRLCQEVSQTTGYLARGFVSTDGTLDQRAIDAANACFTRLDGHVRAIADLVLHIEQHRQVDYGACELKRVVSRHFSSSSDWYLASREHYCSGRIAPDGSVLRRVCIPLDPLPTPTPSKEHQGAVVQHQAFALETAQSRLLLTRTTRQVQTRLNHVYAAVGAYLVAHCPSASELLHPSTK